MKHNQSECAEIIAGCREKQVLKKSLILPYFCGLLCT